MNARKTLGALRQKLRSRGQVVEAIQNAHVDKICKMYNIVYMLLP